MAMTTFLSARLLALPPKFQKKMHITSQIIFILFTRWCKKGASTTPRGPLCPAFMIPSRAPWNRLTLGKSSRPMLSAQWQHRTPNAPQRHKARCGKTSKGKEAGRPAKGLLDIGTAVYWVKVTIWLFNSPDKKKKKTKHQDAVHKQYLNK